MNGRFLLTVVTAAALAGPAGAQMQRRANMTGGGNGNGGRCVADVVVDGAAELTLSGDTANLRDLSGRPPQWRNFSCTSPMPANADVRVDINGRGRAQLVSSPRNGGPAVVRLEDPDGGAATYQVQLTWNGYNAGANQQPGFGGYRDDRDERQYRGNFGPQQAIQVCRDAIRQEASNRFRTNDVNFRRINVDDNPGRRVWVVGTIEVRNGRRDEQYPFSCSVNLDNGRVREARIELPGGGDRNRGSASRDVAAREMDSCRSAVLDRLGGSRIEFGQMQIEDRYGNDVVRGVASERGRSWEFSCSVNPYSGSVRDVDLRRR
jgi:hypothetical protein